MATVRITPEEATRSRQAYLAFGEYAGHGEEDLSMFSTLRRLQIEQHRWQEKALSSVADRSTSVMLHGMSEEACWELPQAIEAGDQDEQCDALGDLLIYTCSACTHLRLDFSTLAQDFDVAFVKEPTSDAFVELMKTIGMFNHVIGKHRQKTRGYDDMDKVREDAGAVIARLCSVVQWMCYANDWDTKVMFEETLNKVMKRDWTKNALTGESPQTTLPLE